MHEFHIEKSNIKNIKYIEKDMAPLKDGDVLCKVDKYGFTANNISYAVAGDTIGYWQFFPTGDDTMGIIPVWGFADVIESKCDDIAVGERLYGYFPMGSHLVITPANVKKGNVFDGADHRSALPPVYNMYQRTKNDPAPLTALEDERMILFPLFATSYFNYDFLECDDYFGADEVVIGSASSKTALWLARMVHEKASRKIHVRGLTSAKNKAFVEGLGYYDSVTTYGEIDQIPTDKPATFVDMSGNQTMIKSVHAQYGDQLKYSCMIGATHWDEMGDNSEAVGVTPTFFFAPGHIMKREAELGQGVLIRNALAAFMEMADEAKKWLDLEPMTEKDDVIAHYQACLDGTVDPKLGAIIKS